MARNPYVPWAIKMAKKYGVPVGILLAQINQESGWNPRAGSSAGAQGIAQFMPGTWANLMQRYGTSGSPWDPYLAIRTMAHYMGGLIKQYGNVYDPLSVYNSGRPWSQGQHIGQTNAYVKNIISASKHYGQAYDGPQPAYTPPGSPANTPQKQYAQAQTQAQAQANSQVNAQSVDYSVAGFSPDVMATLPGIYGPGQVPVDAQVGPIQQADTWRLIAAQPLSSQESQMIAQRVQNG